MYIRSVLLYKCSLSVYSPFLLVGEVHSPARLVPVRVGGVGLKPCASCVLTRMVWVFCKSRGNQTIKCTKCALWVNRPDASSLTLGINDPKSLVTAIVSLGLCEINFFFKKGKWNSKQTHIRIRFNFSHRLTRHRLNLWHLSARTASFTMQKFKKKTTVCNRRALYRNSSLSAYCILRLSLSTPVLNFPSRSLRLCEICWYAGSARPARVYVLYYLQSTRAAGFTFGGGRSHQGAQYYLCVRWVEQPLGEFGVDLSLFATNHCFNLNSSETFVIRSTFSVFTIKNFQTIFGYPRKSASLLSSAVIWCFFSFLFFKNIH